MSTIKNAISLSDLFLMCVNVKHSYKFGENDNHTELIIP